MKRKHLPSLVLLVACLARTACPAALQFDAASVATNAANAVTGWVSRDGTATFTPLHAASNGWSHATLRTVTPRRRSVDFASTGSTSPLHAEGATGTVAYAFAVVRCEVPADLSTLFDAPCSVRFAPSGWDPPAPWAFATSQLGSTAEYAVNGTATNAFAGAAGFQLVEVTWDDAVPLDALYVGNAAASPLWNRAWAGEVAELVFLDRTPTPAERDALRRYASLKWGVPVSAPGTDAPALLRDLGVETGALFATVLEVR